jgi:hypothetical protein
MSIASRDPLPVPSLACSHGYPKLIDDDGNVMRGAVRRELAARPVGPGAWPFGRFLAVLFAKVRLQRKWAIAEVDRRAEAIARAAAARAALDAEAAEVAERCNFNTLLLRFQRDRYTYGSLAVTHRARHMRTLYGRALDIALDRNPDIETLIAAE